jgi:ATP-dependent Clp protease ATP-binding subunit ClpC
MYERFTDRSRKVMQLAAQEAQRFNHEYIGTEHILLGLVKEGSGVAANVLKNLDIDLHKVRLEVEKVVRPGPGGEPVAAGRLPHTPPAKKVIEYAHEEARRLRHNYVGTEHLLLGLVREDGVAARVLLHLGLRLEDVSREVALLLGHDPSTAADGGPDAIRVATRPAPYPGGTPAPADPTRPEPLTADQLGMIADRIRHLTEQVQVFVAAADFTLAARCRAEADALTRVVAWYEWVRR